MTELSDQTLLTYWYRNRNAEAFHILASRHARMVYATALRVLRDVQAAEDVSQESFLALAQAKRPPSRNVAAWLHRTAYHAALDVIRSRKRRDARELEYGKAQPGATHITWDDIRELVDEAVMALPEAQREPLVRYFFEQESHATIATALGIPRQTVTHRIGKGIEQVRQRLKEEGVIAPAAAALVTLIQENSASALPVAVMQEVGRTALVASPSVWAVFATYTSGAAIKAAAAMLVVGGGVAASVQVVDLERLPPQAPQTVQAATTVISPNSSGPGLTSPAVLAQREVVSDALPASKVALPVSSAAEEPSGASVSGAIVFPDGKPFAGATVHLWSTKARELAAIPGAGPVSGHAAFNAVADESGSFSIGEMAPGEYGATLTEPGSGDTYPNYEYTRFNLKSDEHKDDLLLTYGTEGNLTISGVVVNSVNRPVPGARVTTSLPVPRNVGTDALGRFTIPYLPEGKMTVYAQGAAYFANRPSPNADLYAKPLMAKAGDQDLHIVLIKGAAIGGRVIDARTQQPVTRFDAIHLPGHQQSFPRSTVGRQRPIESADGSFQLDSVRVGEVTVLIEAAGYTPSFTPLTIGEGEQIRDLLVALEPSNLVLSGKVVDEGGAPVPNAKIYLGDVPSAPMREKGIVATTGPEGEFRLDGAPTNLQFVGVFHPNFAPGGSEPETQMKNVLKRAARLHVEVQTEGKPLSDVRVIAHYRGAPGERFTATSARATTGPDGRATVIDIMPGNVQVSFLLPSKRSRSLMLEMAPGEDKSLQMEIPPASAAVHGVVTMNGAPASEGSVTLHVETESGPEGQSQAIAQDGSFRFSEVPLGAAELVVSTEPGAGRTFVHDVSLAAGEVTELTVDATMVAGVRGTVTGLPADEMTSVAVLLGAMNLEEAAEAADRLSTQRDLASHVAVDDAGAYEAPLQKPGTYTLLLMSSPKESHWKINHHEARVVEVPESGELEADFTLPD